MDDETGTAAAAWRAGSTGSLTMETSSLADVRVLEIGELPAGALCARLFADFGADVLKLERPEGDRGRHVAPLIDIGGGRQEGAYFSFLNVRKRSALLEREALSGLLAETDVLVDSLSPSERAELGIDHAELQAQYPQLVIAAISWFGDSGPYSTFAGSDAVVRALAGGTQLVGPVEGPPVPLHDYQTSNVGGLTAFIAAMASIGHLERRGRRLELPVLDAAIALADYNVALAWAADSKDRRWGVSRFSPNYPLGIYKCKEGWIGVTVVTPVQWRGFCSLLGVDDLGRDPRFVERTGRLNNADELEARFKDRFLEKTADEWFQLALAQMLPMVVVPGMDELLVSPEFNRRNAFETVRHGSCTHEQPASPLRLQRTPPLRGGDVPLAGNDPAQWRTASRQTPALAVGPARAPLDGIRIVDLSMGWAGPLATRHFAELGAEVIKVEATQYPDWWRGVDDRPVVFEKRLYEKSSYFNVLSRSKKGITLDLTTEEGRRLVKDLIRDADIVIDNYSAGVLPKLGLDYDQLREVNPELIMLSMPAFGTDGPWRECRAYGSTLEQASGLPSVAGRPEDPPSLVHIAYGDPIGGLHAASALLVALHHKLRTGKGQRIILSQVECMLTMVAPWVIEQSANGSVKRMGTRHPQHAPHGMYRCAGEDAWLMVAITSDAQWLDLCAVIDRPDLAGDATLSTAAGRREAHERIDAAINAWTGSRTHEDAMEELQSRGVPAGVSRPPVEMLKDRHLIARDFWQYLEREFSGTQPQPSPPYKDSLGALPALKPSPLLGQFNQEILGGLLGLSDAQLKALSEKGIIGNRAVPPELRKSRAARGSQVSTA
ncbi:CaiB/BaiF CoA transferase family protein [Paraburkholderia antibiotica]|uniref:CoA transferase n=1 Tax=Paraburkholderia antibiotica TaxID=2728839 RepID=A0A7X9X7H9_9BURK|nr:CoA transferase [Paraburkholderia antibiotica]NML32870.1 CoA transferase [Paraburkholderia antibiotica]